MTTCTRPVSVTVLSCLYIAVGIAVFTYHFSELMALQHDSVWIELVELSAVVSGVFMLLGQNWARWLALVWIAFHVAISFPVLREVAIHSLLFIVIAWVLFRPDAARYFRWNEEAAASKRA